jgi:two-component SAPR family response regulator
MIEAKSNRLKGLRILLVEDEYLVACEIAHMLRALGCEVAGPVPSCETALDVLRREAIDGALLDVKLQGEDVLPVADWCAEHDVPFIFTTGYDTHLLSPRYETRPHLEKPFARRKLRTVARQVFGGHYAA